MIYKITWYVHAYLLRDSHIYHIHHSLRLHCVVHKSSWTSERAVAVFDVAHTCKPMPPHASSLI